MSRIEYKSFCNELISSLFLQMDRLDPMQNQMCRVCEEPAAGFHFGAFTCEGCKSFFGRTCNNQSVIQECKNNYRCVINKKNRTACKACRLRKCLMVGMSKSGSRYGRRSNWFKIHCLMQQAQGGNNSSSSGSTTRTIEPSPMNHHHHIPQHQHQQPPSVVVPPVPPRSTTNTLGSPPLWRPLDSPSPKASPPPAASAPPSMPKSSVFNFLPQAVAQAQAAAAAAAVSQNNLKTKESIDSLSPRSTPVSPPPATPSISTPATTVLNNPFTFPTSLYSMPFGNPALHHFLPPTFNIPGLSGLPLHKQALLSPLLASSHFLAAARKAYPFGLPGSHQPASPTPPTSEASTTDVLAEHKALIERFRASAAAMAAAAAMNNNKEDADEKSASPPLTSEVMMVTQRPQQSGHQTIGKAMDLTSKRQSGSEVDGCDQDSVSSVGSEIIPHLSDTDEEEAGAGFEPASATNGLEKQPRKESESMPLDLTCV